MPHDCLLGYMYNPLTTHALLAPTSFRTLARCHVSASHADTLPKGHTNTRIQHVANYRTLHTPLLPYTNYPHTQALPVLTNLIGNRHLQAALGLRAAHGVAPPRRSTAREPPLWIGTADRDICLHAGIPLHASDSEFIVLIFLHPTGCAVRASQRSSLRQ